MQNAGVSCGVRFCNEEYNIMVSRVKQYGILSMEWVGTKVGALKSFELH